MNRKHQSRHERDEQLQTYIVYTLLGAGVLVLGLLAFGLVDHFVLTQQRAVARVNGQDISLAQLKKLSSINAINMRKTINVIYNWPVFLVTTNKFNNAFRNYKAYSGMIKVLAKIR